MNYITNRMVGKIVSVLTGFSLVFSMGYPALALAARDNNPGLPSQACGLDIALVLDSSGSIDSDELNTMQDAFHDFVGVFLPGTPTEFSVVDFDSSASIELGLSSDVDDINDAIDNPTSGGGTNWLSGLNAATTTLAAGRASAPDLIIFASDGNPTDPGSDANALSVAVAAADSIKVGGTRIITLGIGNIAGQDALDPDNLKDISSDDAYYDVASFDDLASTLQGIATDLCGGTITVTKVIDRDGDLGTTDDQSPAAGWEFNIGGNAGQMTTDPDGKTSAVEIDTPTASVTETDGPAGYTFAGATCTNTNHDNVEVGTAGENAVNDIALTDEDVISCVFYNKPAEATLQLFKTVVNDGTPEIDLGNSSSGDFELVITTSTTSEAAPFATQSVWDTNGFGTTTTVAGDSYYSVSEPNSGAYAMSYSEALDPEDPNYDADSNCSGFVGAAGNAYCTIVNNDLPSGKGAVTVVKSVNNFWNTNEVQPSETSFTFDVGDGNATTTSISGEAILLDAGTYTIVENGPTSGYTATYSGSCAAGVVTVVAGQAVNCTITNTYNAPVSDVSIDKTVNDDSADVGQTLTYTLTATNHGPSSATNVMVMDVLPGDLTYVGSSATQGSYDSSTHVWTIGNLALDGVATLTITASVNSGTEGHTIANSASVTVDNNDNNAENNADSVNVSVNTPPAETPPTGGGGGNGGGNGPIPSGGGGGGNPNVLGASTGPVIVPQVLGATCGIYLESYLRINYKNDIEQVKKLQSFLNENLGTSLPISGYFGTLTDAAVRQFQAKYSADILKPWVLAGQMPSETPTGYVYKTTKRWINLLKCPSLDIPMPQLP